jgi:hypothetical protein
MPYYDTINITNSGIADYSIVDKTNGARTVLSGGEFLRKGSIERGFRTRPPLGQSVKIVPNKVADPYSWFTDLNELKKRAALANGFDSSMFRTDKGHPWTLEKFEFIGEPMSWSVNSSSWAQRRYYVAFPSHTYSGYYVPSTSDLQSWAAIKYGQMAPSADRFSLPAFVGELREGLPGFIPSLMKVRDDVSFFRSLGSDYLNVQFGWKPFLNDLRALAEVLFRVNQELFSPWGATHRSRGEDPQDTMVSDITSGYSGGFGNGDYFDTPFRPYLSGSGTVSSGFILGSGMSSRQTRVRKWIEGEYVYLPKAGVKPDDFSERFETLMKTELTPSDLWQLAPWSWLVDWFTQLGSAIESIEIATSNRVLSTYCYAMEEVWTRVQTVVYSIRGETGVSYTGPTSWSGTWEYTKKRRIRANPFGFTLNAESALSGAQFAILGALGLTKIRR